MPRRSDEDWAQYIMRAPAKELIKTLGVSRAEAGQLLGVSPQAVSLWLKVGRVPRPVRYLILARDGYVMQLDGNWQRRHARFQAL